MYEALNVSVHIGGRPIIERVNLAIAPGRVIVVIGPNGAGKSTLLRTMAGERKAATGDIRLNGRDIREFSPRALAARRAVLAQSLMLSAPFTVDAIMRLGIPATVREATAAGLVQRAIAAIDLADALERPVTHLSGGEQQRVHAGRVLVQLWAQPNDGEPRYLLLDEPTTHLDPAHQLLILALAKQHAAGGGGVLAVLHDLNLAAAIADDIAVMNRGRIVAFGPPEAVLESALLREVYGVAFDIIRDNAGLWVRPRMAG